MFCVYFVWFNCENVWYHLKACKQLIAFTLDTKKTHILFSFVQQLVLSVYILIRASRYYDLCFSRCRPTLPGFINKILSLTKTFDRVNKTFLKSWGQGGPEPWGLGP